MTTTPTTADGIEFTEQWSLSFHWTTSVDHISVSSRAEAEALAERPWELFASYQEPSLGGHRYMRLPLKKVVISRQLVSAWLPETTTEASPAWDRPTINGEPVCGVLIGRFPDRWCVLPTNHENECSEKGAA